MIYRAAVVRESDNIVENVVIANDQSVAPLGCYLVNVEGVSCDIGWSYDATNNNFVSNQPPAEEVPA